MFTAIIVLLALLVVLKLVEIWLAVERNARLEAGEEFLNSIYVHMRERDDRIGETDQAASG